MRIRGILEIIETLLNIQSDNKKQIDGIEMREARKDDEKLGSQERDMLEWRAFDREKKRVKKCEKIEEKKKMSQQWKKESSGWWNN